MSNSRMSSAVFCIARSTIKNMAALVAVGLALAASSGVAHAKDTKVGNLVIEAPWSRATPGRSKIGVGYLAIVNIGNKTDMLKAASSPIAERVEVHATSMRNGVMRMRRVENGVEIKAQEVTEFKPGGLHLMLIGLKKPIVKDETFPVQLVFAKAGKVDLTFTAAGIGAAHPPTSLGIGEAGGSHSGSDRQKKNSH
jgi:copper(I)-binding protein